MRFLAGYARFLLVAIAAQFYAAGLAIFGATSFVPHAIIGWSLVPLSAGLALAALVSRGRRVLALPALAVLMFSIAQPILALGLQRWPWVAAAHPAVALAIAWVLLYFSRRADQVQARS